MESSLVSRMFNWLGNDAAIANAQVLLEARDRTERELARLADRLAAADPDHSVTAA